MDQTDSAALARRMGDLLATYCTNVGIAPVAQKLLQYRNAAFEQIFEFIPDDATATVMPVPEANGEPMLLAVADHQFFKLVFAEVDLESDDLPATKCESAYVAQGTGIISAETQYSIAPAGAPMRRTTWTFGIGSASALVLESIYNPESPNPEPNERFAQALALAMGWPELSPRAGA